MDMKKVQDIRKALNAGLFREFEARFGVKVSIPSSISFLASNATVKIEVSEVTADGVVQSKEITDFARYATRFGLKPTDLGKEFNYQGDNYKIVGMVPRSRRAPVLAQRTKDVKQFLFPAISILQHLNRLI